MSSPTLSTLTIRMHEADNLANDGGLPAGTVLAYRLTPLACC